MGFGTFIAMGNVASGQIIAIDADGNIRILQQGDSPRPGEVLIAPDGSELNPDEVAIQLVGENNETLDVTQEVNDIIAEVEQALADGEDITPGEGEETAAGEDSGSSLTDSGTVVRDAAELIAQTNFDTQGFDAPQISQTQSLSLLEQFRSFQQDPIFVDFTLTPEDDSVNVFTDEDTPLDGQLVATDANPNDVLTFSKLSDPANGDVVVNPDGSWTYTPDLNYNGPDAFSVTVSDGNGGFDNLQINIGVNPVNDAPNFVDGEEILLGDINVVTKEDEPIGGTVDATDVDGDDLTYSIETQPANGSVTIDQDGTWVFTPDEGFNSNSEDVSPDNPDGVDDTFVIQVSDGNGGFDLVTVNVEVEAVAELYVEAGDPVTEEQGAYLSFTVGIDEVVKPDVDLTLTLGAGSDSATKGVDYEDALYVSDGEGGFRLLTQDDLTIVAGNTELEVFIKVFDDKLLEGEETVTLQADVNSDYVSNNSDDDQSSIIDETTPSNDDTVYVEISVDKNSVAEGGELVYTLKLVDSEGNDVTPPAGTEVSGSLTWTGAAAGGLDTSALPDSFTIGDTGTAQFTVDAVDDFLLEGSEPITATVGNVTDNDKFEAVAASATKGSVDSAITDEAEPDGADTVYVEISVDKTSVAEGGELVYTLKLVDSEGNDVTPPAGTEVSGSLTWTGAAAGGLDTSALPDSFTIGDTGTAQFTVDAVDDFLLEGSEPITATVGNVTDNDKFEAVAASATKGSVDSAITDEAEPDGADTVYVEISVDKTSVAEGGELVYTLKLVDSEGNDVTPPAGTEVSGSLTWTGAAAGGLDTSALPDSFTIGDTGTAQFTVDAVDDFLLEGSEPITATVGNVTDNDKFEAVAASATKGSVDSAITDEAEPDGADTVYVEISVDKTSVAEGGELVYTLKLVDSEGNDVTPPAGTEVSGSLTWTGAAASGLDTSALPDSFTIGDTGTALFTVDAVDDFLLEGSEPITATVGNVTDNDKFEAVAASATKGSVDSAITDEAEPDGADTVYVEISVDKTSVAEGGELVYTLKLVDSEGNDVTPPAGTEVSGSLTWTGAAAGGLDTSALPDSFTIGDTGSAQFTVDAVDDVFNEGGEPITATIGNVSDNGAFELVDASASKASATSEITDEDGSDPQNPRDPVVVTLTGPESVMEGDTTTPYTITLTDPSNPGTGIAGVGDIITLTYSYTNADGTDITEQTQAIVNADGYTANFTVETIQDEEYEEGQAFTVSVVSVTDSGGVDLFEALTLTDASQTTLIDDSKDNPPEAKDFTVELDSNGGAPIVFDSATPSQDQISDDEDDAAGDTVRVVITDLPDSGTLLYNGVPLTESDLTQFDANGDVIGSLNTFDPNGFTYQNDDESTGFFLGVDESPDGMTGDESTSNFLNWGQPVDGDPTKRELRFEDSDDVITISAISNNDKPLTQYFGDKGHVGYGLGVGGGDGINQGETIQIDMTDRPAESITVGLDGMGGWFQENHPSHPTMVQITVYLDDGSTIVKEVTKPQGESSLFQELTISASESSDDAKITKVEFTTIGDGNWELKSFEANPSDDTIDYRAVDTDDNVSEERTVTFGEADNAPPVATDDPVAFSVALGEYNSNSWEDDGAAISASYQGDDRAISQSGVKRGVAGDENGGPGPQLQFNRTDGESEQFKIELDNPVTEFTFSVNNLVRKEGGEGNHEQGKWVAYLGDNPVASGMFVANEGRKAGEYSFDSDDLGGVAFDSIVFEAVDFVNHPAQGEDSSDYYLTGFTASSSGAYAANQGEEFAIPISELLGNDADPDGDNIRFTHVSEVNNADIRIEDGMVYIDLDDDFTGPTTFDYVITDDKGGFSEATVSIIVNPLPQPVGVDGITLLDDSVQEGDSLVFQVTLDGGPLEEGRYDVTFGNPSDTATDSDVDLSNAFFTHGVTYDQGSGQLVVPIGVSNFSVIIPTLVDGIYELTEDYTLALGLPGDAPIEASGAIENVDIPEVQVSDDLRVSEGDDAVFTVSLTTETEVPTKINLSVNHLSTEPDDVGNMVVEHQTNAGWQTLTVGPNGDVVLPAGVDEVRVTIPTTDDNGAPIYEGVERFELLAEGVEGATGNDSGRVAIFDDGSFGPQGPNSGDDDRPAIDSISEPTVEEGGVAEFDVTMSNPSTTPTNIVMSLNEGNATSPEDYDGAQVVVEFGNTTQTLDIDNSGHFRFSLPAGETDFTVKVQTNNDNVADDGEQFLLDARTQYQVGREEGIATIADNEAPSLDLDGSQYQIEFVSESAGYKNVFGYYVYDETSDTQELVILMENSHDSRGNGFDPVLGQLDSLDNVGYFLIPNGGNAIANAPDNAVFEVNDAGELLIDGNVAPNQTVYSTHGENSTLRVSEGNDGETVLSFDDQIGHPRDDDDYNDLVIKVTKLDDNVDYQTTFTEGDDPVSIADLDADIFDDKDSIKSMEVTLTNKFADDALVLPANTTGFTITPTVTNGTIVLSIVADDPNGLSADAFETLLKGIGFENSGENPDETDRIIEVSVTDNAGNVSNTATTTVQVIEVPDLTVGENASGDEDNAIPLTITLPQDSSVTEIQIKGIPDGASLESNANPIAISNGVASLTPAQLNGLAITPPLHSDEDFSLDVDGFTATNELIEQHQIDVDVSAVTDAPTLEVEGADILSFHNFDSIDLGDRSWRGNVDSNELTAADTVEGISDGAEGTWGTENDRGGRDYTEVGQENVYLGRGGDPDNNVFELEGRNGDDNLFTEFTGEAGHFYNLSLDVAARRVDDSPMTIFLEDGQGNRTILFEFDDSQNRDWNDVSVNFATPADGDYKIVFESETSTNSYGALLDNIKLETLDNVGYEDSYIPLSDINANLVDTDGSEQLTVELDLSDLPGGSKIKAPDGSVLDPDVDGLVDVSAWSNNLDDLFIMSPEPGTYPLDVIVTSQDNAPGVPESVNQIINVTVLPVLDAQSKEIEIVEDNVHVISLADLGITDTDATLFITELSEHGTYELQTAPNVWEVVEERDRIDVTDIDAGNLRFTPTLNETGHDDYPDAGEGNLKQDYSSLTFVLEKGDARSDEMTLTIDVTPEADIPNLTITTPDLVLPEQSFTMQRWGGVVVDPIYGVGKGVDSTTLINEFADLNSADASTSTIDNLQDTAKYATVANTAVLVTGLIYLEAGQSYDFVGRADDSMAIKVGGEVVDEARWGVNRGEIQGGAFVPSVNGYYPIEVYHHNQNGPGNFNIDVSINGEPAVDLSNSNLSVVPDEAALDATDLRTSELQIVDGKHVYEVYGYNEGEQDTEIPLSDIASSLNDLDTSEELTVLLSGLPKDAVLSDGTNSVPVGDSGEVDVTDWNLTELTILPPAGYYGEFTIDITATADEIHSTSEANAYGTIEVVVHENQATVTASNAHVVDEDSGDVAGNLLADDVDSDNVLYVASATIGGVSYNIGEAISLPNGAGTFTLSENGDYLFEPADHWSGVLPEVVYTTNTGASDTLNITVTPVAEVPDVSIVFGESEVNNGDVDTPVTIIATTPDTDGSEQIQSVIIAGLPNGALVTDGQGNPVGQAGAGGWELPVTGAAQQQYDVVITHPQGSVLDIDVSATAIETANNDSETTTENAASLQDIYADQGGETPRTVMSLVIDSSGSMGTKPFYDQSGHPQKDMTRMELVLEASIELLKNIQEQEGSEDVLVQLIDFDNKLSNDSQAMPMQWGSVSDAISKLETAMDDIAQGNSSAPFAIGGATDYEEAVYAVMNGYNDAAVSGLTNTNDQIFFLSDGRMNAGWSDTSNDTWDAFIADKHVTSVGVGVPSNIPEAHLREVAGADGKIVYIPDANIKADLPKLRPTIGQMGALLAMITGLDAVAVVLDPSKLEVLQKVDTDGTVTRPTVDATLDNGELVIDTEHGDLRIREDGSYFFQPDPSAADIPVNEAIGYEVLYSVTDAMGEESQHVVSLNVSADGSVKADSYNKNGSTGDDHIVGTDNDDILMGHQGDDILDGGLGDDFLFGGAGDDHLIGGQGNDILSGGEGSDIFVWMDSDLDGGLDVITDFTVNEDKIDISDLLQPNETMEQLLDDISATIVDDNNIQLTIDRGNGQTQSIKIDDLVDQIDGIDGSGGPSITGNELTSLLNEIIKPQEM
ncbi:Ig-like domain-containing protein [Vibrio intestinalis]|uniref:Ig-like domain-containing protein n=1 Tax=Vibrio intestinalis TaxID=2933291 RepID=UPI0021A756FA|nr:Ig-like domain-containing protein [Vibrio intestinalis]